MITVVLPSLLLVAITLRMISQELELAQNRIADEHRRLAGEINQHLLFRYSIRIRQIKGSKDLFMCFGFELFCPEHIGIADVEAAYSDGYSGNQV